MCLSRQANGDLGLTRKWTNQLPGSSERESPLHSSSVGRPSTVIGGSHMLLIIGKLPKNAMKDFGIDTARWTH
jgi:hypothetical protein